MVKWKSQAGLRGQGSFRGECALGHPVELHLMLWPEELPHGGVNKEAAVGSQGCEDRDKAAEGLFETKSAKKRDYLRNQAPLEHLYLLDMMHTTSQGIQLHLHFKVKIQSSREIEVLFLLGKQWILQGGKYSRGTRKLSLVLRFMPASQQQPQFSPASVYFSSFAKSQSPRNYRFTPVGFCFSSAQEREVGVQKQMEAVSQLPTNMPQKVFYLWRHSDQTVAEDPWCQLEKRNLFPVAQFRLFFQTFALSLGVDRRAVGTSKLPLSLEKPGLGEGILGTWC